jgi:3-methylfumaryl-CoA hydratase
MAEHQRVDAVVMVDPAPVHALAALFDDGLPAPGPGDPLPPLWHWAALASWAPGRSTGPDGHPRVGEFLPDVGKPRRMFAGGRVALHRPLVVGTQVRRTDEVVSVTPKSGRQGDFVLVEVRTTIEDASGRLALEERQDLVYRDQAVPQSVAATPSKAAQHEAIPVAPALLARGEDDVWRFSTDPTKLMRFSAATSNGHRIHYDLDYATQVECYPGLVVHGPLMSITLAEVLRREGTPVTALDHRGLRPLFCGARAEVRRRAEPDGRLTLAVTTTAGDHSTLTAG